MKFELWLLAVVDRNGSWREPWAGIHATYSGALARVWEVYGDGTKMLDEEAIREALDDVAEFHIETTIIDTDELTGLS